jgi:PAS domain S-box-containing protein
MKPDRRSSSPVPLSLEQVLRASDVILDVLPIATCVCDSTGSIIQYNRRAIEIWGRAPEPKETHEHFSAATRYYELDGKPLPRSEIPMSQVLRTGAPMRDRELIVERPDGSRIVVSVNIDPLFDHKRDSVGAISCALSEQEQRLAATYEHAAIGISEADANGRIMRVNEAACSILGRSREELLGSHLFQRTHPADAEWDIETYRRQVAGELGFYSVEKRMRRPDGRIIWISVRSSSVRDGSGAFLYAVRVLRDITERKESEERQKLLIGELNHRVKNTLATVQSLAAQTARVATSPEHFRERFEGRLIALSKAHDQLTIRHWQSADLREIIRSAVGPYLSRSEGQLSLRGMDVTLRPRAALTLAMAFHELTTNAVKYGALSIASGSIQVSWAVQPGPSGTPALLLEWREEGGPVVAVPLRRSFGTKFIERSIASELGGHARLTFAESGLRCTIELPFGSAGLGPEISPP